MKKNIQLTKILGTLSLRHFPNTVSCYGPAAASKHGRFSMAGLGQLMADAASHHQKEAIFVTDPLNPFMNTEQGISLDGAIRLQMMVDQILSIMKTKTHHAVGTTPYFKLTIKEALVGVSEVPQSEKDWFYNQIRGQGLVEPIDRHTSLDDDGFFEVDGKSRQALKEAKFKVLAAIQKRQMSGHLTEIQAEKLRQAYGGIDSNFSDSMYGANRHFYLGKSKVAQAFFGTKEPAPICLGQTPKLEERGVEFLQNFFALFPDTIPIFLDKNDNESRPLHHEGMADQILLKTAFGPKWLCHVSSRTNPKTYPMTAGMTERLDMETQFSPQDMIDMVVRDVKLSELAGEGISLDGVDSKYLNQDLKDLYYHEDLGVLVLEGTVILPEGVYEESSIAELRKLGQEVLFLPHKETLEFAMNSIILNERYGCEKVAFIPKGCPTLAKILGSKGYEVHQEDNPYRAGGGYIRCMFNMQETSDELPEKMTLERYFDFVDKLHEDGLPVRVFTQEERTIMRKTADRLSAKGYRNFVPAEAPKLQSKL